MFWSDGGILTPFGTLKERPIASPGLWYGSCPIITILIFSIGQVIKALKIKSFGGYTIASSYSLSTKDSNLLK